MTTVADLATLLRKLELNDKIEYKEYLTDGPTNLLHPDIKTICDLASDLFITNQGTPNNKNINESFKNGYGVFKGEGDSFGWLSAVIPTSKGQIVFG